MAAGAAVGHGAQGTGHGALESTTAHGKLELAGAATGHGELELTGTAPQKRQRAATGHPKLGAAPGLGEQKPAGVETGHGELESTGTVAWRSVSLAGESFMSGESSVGSSQHTPTSTLAAGCSDLLGGRGQALADEGSQQLHLGGPRHADAFSAEESWGAGVCRHECLEPPPFRSTSLSLHLNVLHLQIPP
ncbi:hypothetical protein EYF80_048790 [Liparis tanakae]|uniref:Uncharacterized protein n=1 Tax=Liparis tanakae TaxID=230148 RepID=A0A4Z2FJU6_9TELE|nr:hypothetical protein EYF80_048790 [Liparis tanakae]